MTESLQQVENGHAPSQLLNEPLHSKEPLIEIQSVIPTGAESAVFRRFCEVEGPAFD